MEQKAPEADERHRRNQGKHEPLRTPWRVSGAKAPCTPRRNQKGRVRQRVDGFGIKRRTGAFAVVVDRRAQLPVLAANQRRTGDRHSIGLSRLREPGFNYPTIFESPTQTSLKPAHGRKSRSGKYG